MFEIEKKWSETVSTRNRNEIIFSKYPFLYILSIILSLSLFLSMSASPLPRVVAGRRTVLRCRRRQAVWPVYSSVAEASPPLHLSLSLSLSRAPVPLSHPPRHHRLFLSLSSICRASSYSRLRPCRSPLGQCEYLRDTCAIHALLASRSSLVLLFRSLPPSPLKPVHHR